MTRSDPATPEHDSFLDRAFETILEHWNQGSEIPVEALLAERPELSEEIEELVKLARRIAVQHPPGLPSVAGYEILEELGRGAMGTVFLARQLRLERLVALKVLPPAFMISKKARQRFLLEARALAKLRHPNIVAVHDVVEQDDVCAYAMEFVDGITLAELLGRLPQNDAPPSAGDLRRALRSEDPRAFARGANAYFCSVGIAVARALGAVHEAGILHRDVKPSNILLRGDGSAMLSDFGLVFDEIDPVHTVSGQFLGTPAYAPPEQLAGNKDIDERADIYSLGVTLYETFGGRRPYEAPSATRLIERAEAGHHKHLRRVAPWLPRDLSTIVEKAIDPSPQLRYQDADELANDLQRFLELRPIEARGVGWGTRVARFVQRHRSTVVAGITATLVIAVVAVVLLMQANERRLAREQITEELELAQTAWLLSDPMDVVSDTVRPITEIWGRAQEYYSRVEQLRRSAPLTWPHDERFRMETLILSCAHELATQGGGGIEALEEPYPNVFELARKYRVEGERALTAFLAGGNYQLDPWSTGERRALGLLAYLLGESELSRMALARLDLDLERDLLVDSVLGQHYLAQGDLFRAHLHLVSAVHTHSGSWILALDLADSVLAVDDGRARRVLHEFRGGSECRLSEYHTALVRELESLNLAAAEIYAGILAKTPQSARVGHALARAANRWWSRLSFSGRVDAVLRIQDYLSTPGNCLHDLPARVEEQLDTLAEPPRAADSLANLRLTRQLWRPIADLGLEDRPLVRRLVVTMALFVDSKQTPPDDQLKKALADLFLATVQFRPVDDLLCTVLRAGGAGDNFGSSLAVGDVDGDGLQELAVGAPAGETVRLYDGAKLKAGETAPIAELEDGGWPDRYGTSLHLGANFVGDNRNDLVVGAPHADAEENNAGRISIFDAADLLAGRHDSRTIPFDIGSAIDGANPREAGDATFGASLTSLRREKGRGHARILASAPAFKRNTGVVVALSAHTHDVVWSVVGSGPRVHIGPLAHGIGDLDADGWSDVLVSSNTDEGARARIGMRIVSALSGADGSVIWTYPEVGKRRIGDAYGISYARTGDVNGDGTADLAIGCSDGGPGPGHVVVVAVPPPGDTGSPKWLGDIHPELGQVGFGARLTEAGDANGDGREDFVVLAIRHRGSPLPACSLTLVSGTPPFQRLGTALFRIPSSENNRLTLTSLEDLDGDGVREIALGIANADVANVAAGKVLLLSGASLAR